MYLVVWMAQCCSIHSESGRIQIIRNFIYTRIVNMHCKTLIILIFTFFVITRNIGYTFWYGSKSRNQNKWLTCRSESLFALDINRKSLLNCVITVVPANRNFTFFILNYIILHIHSKTIKTFRLIISKVYHIRLEWNKMALNKCKKWRVISIINLEYQKCFHK